MGGTRRSSTSSVAAMAKTPSLKASSRLVNIPVLRSDRGDGAASRERRSEFIQARANRCQDIRQVTLAGSDPPAKRRRVAQAFLQHEPRRALMRQHVVALVEQ